MRPISQGHSSSSSNKPKFQTKLKFRTGGQSEIRDLNTSVDGHLLSQSQRNSHDHNACNIKEDAFAQTASKLSSVNFNHHDP